MNIGLEPSGNVLVRGMEQPPQAGKIGDVVAAEQKFARVASQLRLIAKHQNAEGFMVALLHGTRNIFVGLFQYTLYDFQGILVAGNI